MVLGWGLMTTLDDHSDTAKKVIYPLITAAGAGALFQIPLIALQAAMPLKDMATSTGAFGFLRTMGGTVGIAIGQAIFTSVLKKKINKIPGLSGYDTSPGALSENVRTLRNLAQPERGEIIHAYTKSLSAIWVFNTPLVGVGFIMVLFIKAYSLMRMTITNADMEAAGGEGTSPKEGPAPAEADISKDRDHTPADNADTNPHANASRG
jgi:hypothetical protein